jgi:hypothetical protein
MAMGGGFGSMGGGFRPFWFEFFLTIIIYNCVAKT